MKLKQGDKITKIILPSIEDKLINTSELLGQPYMISFYRFASCPFCNLRINELVTRYDELSNDFTIVAIFDSSIDNLTEHTKRHQSPFPILADEYNDYYQMFAIEHSLWGMFKGMFLRFPTLIKGMLKGYWPFKIKGSITTMPADFLIDRNGIIQQAYYGKDEGDHLSFEKIKAFSHKEK